MFGSSGMAQESGMFMVNQTIGSVLCCKCGIPMQPNAAKMCVKCLRSEVDITEGLLKCLVLVHCPECESYLQPPRSWVKLQLESKELLTFCLKKLQKNLNSNKVMLVHAEFMCLCCNFDLCFMFCCRLAMILRWTHILHR